MSALPNSLPTEKKPPVGTDKPAARRFAPLFHNVPRELGRLCTTRTEVLVVLNIISEANLRNLDGAIDGWTSVLSTAFFADSLRCTERQVNNALEALTERGMIDRRTVKEALKEKIIKPDEAPLDRYGNVLRLCLAAWSQLEDVDGGKPDPEPEPAEESQPEPVILKLHDEPVVLMPGAAAKPMALSAAVRKRIAKCESIESESRAAFPLSVSFSIHGSALKLSVSFTENNHRKKSSDAESKPVTSVSSLQSYLNPIFLGLFEKTLDAALAARILEALGDCPVETPDGYCFAKFVQKRLGQKDAIKAPWFVNFADEARKTWEKLQAGEVKRKSEGLTMADIDRMVEAERAELAAKRAKRKVN